MSVEIRSYCPSDLEAIKKIHEASGLDYRFPNMNQFPVHKVLEVEGTLRVAYGMRHAVECYLWLDSSGWTDATGKWAAIKALDREATEAARDLGIDSIICCMPPNLKRFGCRISDEKEGLGFTKVRPDWGIFTKHAGDSK